MDYPSNVILLLLQIVLQRQQFLAHQDKTLDLDSLLREPIIDRVILTEFQNHKLVKMYLPDFVTLQMRGLKSLVNEVFEEGIADGNSDDDAGITVISLANHYYAKRIRELESSELPALKTSIIDQLES